MSACDVAQRNSGSPMGVVPTYLDAAAIGLPAVLGLLGAWLGFGRSLVSWPIRWLVSLAGACIAALLAAIYLIVNEGLVALLLSVNAIGKIAICTAAFLVTLVMLLMFMSNLRERVLVWTGHRPIGAMERVFGGLLGIVCGLLLVVWLVAIPHTLYEWLRPDRNSDPAWIRESLSLPYIKGVGAAMKRALSPYLAPATGRPQ
jgi:membrane protein required for colicin V production